MPETIETNLQLLAMIVALLATGAVAIALAGAVPRRRDVLELWRLYGTEFAIVGPVAIAAIDSRILLAALWLFATRGLFEFRDIHGLRLPSWIHVVDGLVAGTVILGAFLWDRVWEAAAIAAVAAASAGYAFAGKEQRPRAALLGAFGVVFPVLPIAFIGLVGRLPEGLAWLLFVFIIVETNDSFALLLGKLFGRHGILPKLSPGKTTEGAIGGVLCGGAVGMILAMAVFGLTAGAAAGCVGVVLVGGILGDVLTSALKRFVGRKDFAPVLVLHGGALDIYDSIVVAAPFFYAYYSLFLH